MESGPGPHTGGMELLTALLIGVPAQVGVFALVPFAWWLQAGRPDGSFLRWLGFRMPEERLDPSVLAILATCGLGFLGGALLGGRPAWAASAGGYWLVLAIAITAVFQTALSEELFFRGFLLRWLGQRRPGPVVANLLQAAACGVVRMAAQWVFVDRALAPSLAALALGAGSAFLAGWVKQRTGSLLLPWAAHGAGNLLGGLIVALR